MRRLAFLLALALAGGALAADVKALLERVPENPMAVVVSEDIRPLVARALGIARSGLVPDAPVRGVALIEAIQEGMALAGGPLVVVRGNGWDLVMMEIKADERDLRAYVEHRFDPVANAPEAAEGAFAFTVGGTRVFGALRQGVLFSASDAPRLKALLDAKPQPNEYSRFYERRKSRLAAKNGVAVLFGGRLLDRLPRSGGRRVAVSMFPLAVLGGEPGPAAVSLSWTRDWERVQAVVETPQMNPLLAILTGAGAPAVEPAQAPAAAHAVLAGRVADMGVYMAALEHVMASVDPRIRDEFRQELAEFNKEGGVDVVTDLTASLAGDWRISAGPDKAGQQGWLVSVGVKDGGARVLKALETLARHDKQPWRDNDGVIETRLLEQPMFLRAAEGRIEASQREAGLGQTLGGLNFMDAAALMGDDANAGLLAYASLRDVAFSPLFSSRIHPVATAVLGQLRTAALAVRVEDGALVARLDIRPGLDTVLPPLAAALRPALDKGRQKAKFAASMNNLKQLCLALTAFASDHGGVLPTELAELAPKYTTSERALTCPLTGPYLYLGAGLTIKDKNPSNTLVAAMSAPNTDGLRAIGFLDGHVQSVVESQAKEMIRQATAAIAVRMAPEKRPGFLWKQDDPVEKGVTWAAFTWGMVRVQGRASREFRNILGEEEPAPTAAAFTDDAVWLGARRGLFRWDRKTGVWTRMAVGGRMFTPSVSKVEIRDGKMSVTASEGGAPETCEYSLKEKRWLQPPQRK